MVTYTTVAKVASRLDGLTVDATTTPSTSDVEAYIEEAEATIDQEMGRQLNDTNLYFDSAEATDVYIGLNNCSNQVWLPAQYKPLISVAGVQRNDSYSDFDPVWTDVTEGTDFLITDIDTGKLKFKTDVRGGISRSLKIGTLTYGYSEVPKIVEKLATNLAAIAVVSAKVGGTARSTNKRLSVGPISITNDSGFSISFVDQMNKDIEKGMNDLSSFKSYAY